MNFLISLSKIIKIFLPLTHINTITNTHTHTHTNTHKHTHTHTHTHTHRLNHIQAPATTAVGIPGTNDDNADPENPPSTRQVSPLQARRHALTRTHPKEDFVREIWSLWK